MDQREITRTVCQKKIHSSWVTRKSGARYCSNCLKFNDAIRDYKRKGYLGHKRLAIIEKELDLQVSAVESEIDLLQAKARSLKDDKAKWQKIVTDRAKSQRT